MSEELGTPKEIDRMPDLLHIEWFLWRIPFWLSLEAIGGDFRHNWRPFTD
jgi:hypothetical protein